MNSLVRGAVGGACVGGGIAIGAYSGGWFLLVAVIVSAVGIGLVVSDFVRSAIAVSEGDPVPVQVDLIDRTTTLVGNSPTLVAGEARPPGDTPFRFQASANLSANQLAEVVRTGRGVLPAEAVGTPGAEPVTEHGGVRRHVPAALAAAAAMWATMLLPPGDFWDLSEVSVTPPAVLSVAGPDERPLWQWYDDAVAHVSAEAPELLDSILDITVNESYVEVWVYLGGDRARVFEGRADGWEASDAQTPQRARDTFTLAELQDFSARDVLSRTAAMLPPDKREPNRMEISRDTEDIFGITYPLRVETWFGDGSEYWMDALPDGTVAPWWPADDFAVALEQVDAALTARGVPAEAPRLDSITLGRDGTGDRRSGSFEVEFARDGIIYRTGAGAGEFTAPDDAGSDATLPGFRFADIDPGMLTRVRDDAMTRYRIDPVDRVMATTSIGSWNGFDSDRGEEFVIEVDYTQAHGGTAYYTLDGQYLSG
ncbi:hypothetical protein HGA13_21880 [Nocardia speluncae]|uniref:Uncharacterized protein n=1 Tax=Nocardia speluncae TaxID=419477 RepID=A0A846XH72_9NOCA|nr:hypothetical protein [Nocardia speluncae]NKY35701.1 hypothetical protein [Nocardia speluncae]